MRLYSSARLFIPLFAVLILAACGNDGPKEPLPRQVKVFVVGSEVKSSGNQRDSLKDQKNPESLSFDATGKVVEVLAQSGASVTAGQALGRLIPGSMSMSESSALISYKAARAELQSAEADHKRYSDLRQQKFISASEFDKRIATIELARAKFEQTMEQLGFVTLRAVESGLITKIDFQVGQQIIAQQAVVKMKLSSSAKNESTATTAFSQKQGSFQIPSEALHSDGASVYRVKLSEGSQEFGVLELIKVTVSSVDESRAVIAEGLQSNDLIISAGWHALTAGQKVRIALIAKAP